MENRGKKGINLIRYADDFFITAPSREVINDYVIPQLERFLSSKGLQLNEAKTHVVHVDEGFDFLGFTIKRYSGKIILVRPAKAKVKAHIKPRLYPHKHTPITRHIKVQGASTLNPARP